MRTKLEKYFAEQEKLAKQQFLVLLKYGFLFRSGRIKAKLHQQWHSTEKCRFPLKILQ